MPTRTDDALLLKRSPFGESSLVVQVLTRRHGRVRLIVKGAYRPNSGYAFVLDYFHTLRLHWSHARGRELAPLRKAELICRRRDVAEDLSAYTAALSVLELAELAARPEHRDEPLFVHTESALEALTPSRLAGPEGGPGAIDRALVTYELAFLNDLGLLPALSECAACGGPAPVLDRARGRVAFSAGAGGRLCNTCAREARASGRRVGTLPLDVLELARDLCLGDATSPAPEVLLRTRDFVERFLNYHLETRPRTQRAFLSVANRNAP